MKRRKKSTPLMLFWSRTEQRRFIDAVERLVSTVNDLGAMLREEKEARSAAARKAAAKRQRAAGSPREPATSAAPPNGEGGGQ